MAVHGEAGIEQDAEDVEDQSPEAEVEVEPEAEVEVEPEAEVEVEPEAEAESERGWPRWARGLGCAAAFCCAALVVGIVAAMLLGGQSDDSGALLDQTQVQTADIDGTYQDPAGATVVISGAAGGGAAGQVTVIGLPVTQFAWHVGGTAPASGSGTWTYGPFQGAPAGIVLQFSDTADATGQNGGAQLLLALTGDASSPTLVCRYPGDAGQCTFTKKPGS